MPDGGVFAVCGARAGKRSSTMLAAITITTAAKTLFVVNNFGFSAVFC